MLSISSLINKLIVHHKPIHDLGIVIIGLVTAIVLCFEVKSIGANTEAALKVAHNQTKIVQLSIDKRKDELSTSIIVRLAKAVDLLSSNTPSTRLAGIYSLERLADDLPDESVAIARIVTTFLTNPPKDTKQDEVRRGFLTLLRIVKKIGTESFISQESNLNLSGLKLEGLHIKDYSFKGFLFSGAHFYNVGFSNIDFTGVNLNGATFEDCYKDGILNFTSANLTDSNIITSNFSEAIFVNSVFNRATIEGGTMENADFSGASIKELTYSNIKFDGSIEQPDIKILH